MTVDDSTPGARSVPPKSTVITPPVPPTAPGSTDLRTKDQLLAALQAEVRMLRTRVDALEAERRRFAQPTATAPAPSNAEVTDSATTATGATSATPMWRTKTGKQAGWQPSRR